MRAVVLGAGSFGTAVAKVLADAGTEVTLWARREAVVGSINKIHENPDYMPGIALPESITATTDAAEALKEADLVVLAVPAQTLRENLREWTMPPDATILSLAKGIELGTSLRMSEVIVDVTGVDPSRVCVLTGPNFAREIALEQPTAAVIAGIDPERIEKVQDAIATRYFRPYTNTDVIGCELGGAVKNVIALAYGISMGMHLGDNAKAALVTRGLAETARLGVALGADPMTFAGLAGLGDLFATCTSPLSRNRTFGEQLGRGATLAEAQEITRQTAEGVKSCLAIRDLARNHGIEMPITEQVERVCHEGVDPKTALAALFGRETKSE